MRSIMKVITHRAGAGGQEEALPVLVRDGPRTGVGGARSRGSGQEERQQTASNISKAKKDTKGQKEFGQDNKGVGHAGDGPRTRPGALCTKSMNKNNNINLR